MMPCNRDPDPDLLILNRTPFGLRRLVIVPWALALGAGLMVLAPLLDVPLKIKVGNLDRAAALRVIVVALTSFAAASLAVGVFLFSRWETFVDRCRQIVVRRWSLLGWRREQVRPLDGVSRVELRQEGHRRAVHPVVLCGAGDEILIVRHPQQYDRSGLIAARRDAARVAAFLEVELHDAIPPV